MTDDPKRGPDGRFASRIDSAIASTRRDGWASALTGIGDETRDKRMSHSFNMVNLSYQDAAQMWLGDDIAARAIEALPAECFRQGHELTIADEGSYDDLKEAVEEKMQELKVDWIIERAMQYERAYGGGAILIGARDGRALDEPMKTSEVNGIDWLTVLEPIEIYPATYYDDPAAPKYGEPEFYRLASLSPGGYGAINGVTGTRAAPPAVRMIHESRLIVFGGIRVSRYHYQMQSSMFGTLWGASMLVRLADVLRDFNIAWHSAGIIVTDFSQSVFSMDGLTQMVGKNEAKLLARMAALEMSRSTARAILIDTKEKFERQSTSVTGLPDLLDRLSSRLAAAIDMPLTLLMGQSPKGLGNEGESDVRFYYDRVRSVQKRRVGPVLRMFAEMIMQTIRKRKVPKKWGIRFNELWQLTDHERAESRLTMARADSMYIKMGAVTPDEIRRARFVGEYSFETSVDESKPAPGFLAPLPSGVLLAAGGVGSGGPGGAGAAGAAGAPGTVGPAAHQVGGYTRKNPTSSGTEPAAKQGGDVAHRDADELLEIARQAIDQVREDRKRLGDNITPAVSRLLDAIERQANADIAWCEGVDDTEQHEDQSLDTRYRDAMALLVGSIE